MFQSLDIHLSAPVCRCPAENLEWQISVDRELLVTCLTCHGALSVPYTNFRATFTFDEPYPGIKEIKTERRLKAIDGGLAKVIPFPKQEGDV